MAASVVTRLQGIVSREIAGSEAAVVTVGSFHAGSAPNIIPDTATLDISVRTFDARLRDRVLASVRRIITAEAQASGAPRAPEIEVTGSYPLLRNDPEASARTSSALATALGAGRIFDPGAVTGSEDVGLFASDAGVPCVYWVLGGADPSDFDGAADFEAVARVVGSLPSNHSPLYAPVPEPTITVGVTALVAAALAWLGPGTTGR